MDLNLENKVAIVTGGSEGLGKAIAISLSLEGVKVAISARREPALLLAAKEIESISGLAPLTFTGDMTKEASVKKFINEVIAETGSVHILINNVGQATRGLLTSLDQSKWQQAFEKNLMSAVFVTTNVVPYMQKQKWGRIINISALSGKEPSDELVASNVVKTGLIALSKTLSRELAAYNILVNSISPGLIESPQNDNYFSDIERKRALDKIPLGRFGSPDEFANTVTFLCSERASYITGVNVLVDGGASHGL
jgi:3-oxoacyl-[acyl-carrier protein] reductase